MLAWLAGEGELPRRAVLVSFDDAYTDLLEVAARCWPSAASRRVVFAVAGHLGGANDWDHQKGAASLRPACAAGSCRAVAASGVEVGSHTINHRPLPEVPAAELER